MIPKFERGILISVIFLVASLLITVFLSPTKKEVMAPREGLETFNVARAQHVIIKRHVNSVGYSDFESLEPVEAQSSGKFHDKKALFGTKVENTTENLKKRFSGLGYSLDAIRDEKIDVPRVFISALPTDFGQIRETRRRKGLFFRTVLPLVLQVNEEIERDRNRLSRLKSQIKDKKKIGPLDRLWLLVLFERYKVERYDWGKLLFRLDVIPPSLALAQAAEESGWGSSRFVHQGNAIFGEWAVKGIKGMIPLRRDPGKVHRVKSFNTLLDSVRAYAKNLNTHRAYRKFRNERFFQRKKGGKLKGLLLAKGIEKYSERGDRYVKTITSIIKSNKLSRFDNVRLAKQALSGSVI